MVVLGSLSFCFSLSVVFLKDSAIPVHCDETDRRKFFRRMAVRNAGVLYHAVEDLLIARRFGVGRRSAGAAFSRAAGGMSSWRVFPTRD